MELELACGGSGSVTELGKELLEVDAIVPLLVLDELYGSFKDHLGNELVILAKTLVVWLLVLELGCEESVPFDNEALFLVVIAGTDDMSTFNPSSNKLKLYVRDDKRFFRAVFWNGLRFKVIGKFSIFPLFFIKIS